MRTGAEVVGEGGWAGVQDGREFKNINVFFFTFMYILCVCIPYNCTVHGADLTNISLLVIHCIIVYVTNKILNLEG